MTLTVRLDETLEAALERYCLATGSSKSLVVQESLAAYLLRSPVPSAKPEVAQGLSDNYKAFQAAGFLGTGSLPDLAGSATNAAVRARIAAHHGERKARGAGKVAE